MVFGLVSLDVRLDGLNFPLSGLNSNIVMTYHRTFEHIRSNLKINQISRNLTIC